MFEHNSEATKSMEQNHGLTKHMEHVKSMSTFIESNRSQESIGLSSSNVSEQSSNSPMTALLLILLSLKLM